MHGQSVAADKTVALPLVVPPSSKMKSFVIAIINDYTGLCYHLLLEALGSLCWHSRVARGERPAKQLGTDFKVACQLSVTLNPKP